MKHHLHPFRSHSPLPHREQRLMFEMGKEAPQPEDVQKVIEKLRKLDVAEKKKVQDALQDALEDAELKARDLANLEAHMEAAIRKADPAFDIPKPILSHEVMLEIAVKANLIPAATLVEIGKRRNVEHAGRKAAAGPETGRVAPEGVGREEDTEVDVTTLSPDELLEGIERNKQDQLRIINEQRQLRQQGGRRRSGRQSLGGSSLGKGSDDPRAQARDVRLKNTAEYWRYRREWEKQTGRNYSANLREQQEKSRSRLEPILDVDGRKIGVRDPETGAHIRGENMAERSARRMKELAEKAERRMLYTQPHPRDASVRDMTQSMYAREDARRGDWTTEREIAERKGKKQHQERMEVARAFLAQLKSEGLSLENLPADERRKIEERYRELGVNLSETAQGKSEGEGTQSRGTGSEAVAHGRRRESLGQAYARVHKENVKERKDLEQYMKDSREWGVKYRAWYADGYAKGEAPPPPPSGGAPMEKILAYDPSALAEFRHRRDHAERIAKSSEKEREVLTQKEAERSRPEHQRRFFTTIANELDQELAKSQKRGTLGWAKLQSDPDHQYFARDARSDVYRYSGHDDYQVCRAPNYEWVKIDLPAGIPVVGTTIEAPKGERLTSIPESTRRASLQRAMELANRAQGTWVDVAETKYLYAGERNWYAWSKDGVYRKLNIDTYELQPTSRYVAPKGIPEPSEAREMRVAWEKGKIDATLEKIGKEHRGMWQWTDIGSAGMPGYLYYYKGTTADKGTLYAFSKETGTSKLDRGNDFTWAPVTRDDLQSAGISPPEVEALAKAEEPAKAPPAGEEKDKEKKLLEVRSVIAKIFDIIEEQIKAGAPLESIEAAILSLGKMVQRSYSGEVLDAARSMIAEKTLTIDGTEYKPELKEGKLLLSPKTPEPEKKPAPAKPEKEEPEKKPEPKPDEKPEGKKPAKAEKMVTTAPEQKEAEGMLKNLSDLIEEAKPLLFEETVRRFSQFHLDATAAVEKGKWKEIQTMTKETSELLKKFIVKAKDYKRDVQNPFGADVLMARLLNEEIILEALGKEAATNKLIITAAVSADPHSFRFAANELRDDKAYVEQLMRGNKETVRGDILSHASKNLRDDPELRKLAGWNPKKEEKPKPAAPEPASVPPKPAPLPPKPETKTTPPTKPAAPESEKNPEPKPDEKPKKEEPEVGEESKAEIEARAVRHLNELSLKIDANVITSVVSQREAIAYIETLAKLEGRPSNEAGNAVIQYLERMTKMMSSSPNSVQKPERLLQAFRDYGNKFNPLAKGAYEISIACYADALREFREKKVQSAPAKPEKEEPKPEKKPEPAKPKPEKEAENVNLSSFSIDSNTPRDVQDDFYRVRAQLEKAKAGTVVTAKESGRQFKFECQTVLYRSKQDKKGQPPYHAVWGDLSDDKADYLEIEGKPQKAKVYQNYTQGSVYVVGGKPYNKLAQEYEKQDNGLYGLTENGSTTLVGQATDGTWRHFGIDNDWIAWTEVWGLGGAPVVTANFTVGRLSTTWDIKDGKITSQSLKSNKWDPNEVEKRQTSQTIKALMKVSSDLAAISQQIKTRQNEQAKQSIIALKSRLTSDHGAQKFLDDLLKLVNEKEKNPEPKPDEKPKGKEPEKKEPETPETVLDRTIREFFEKDERNFRLHTKNGKKIKELRFTVKNGIIDAPYSLSVPFNAEGIPEGITEIRGHLFGHALFKTLPNSLRVLGGFTNSYNDVFEEFPEGLKEIRGNLILNMCTSLKRLPDDLKVDGKINLAETAINIPKGLEVRGDFVRNYLNFIPNVGKGVRIHGDVYLHLDLTIKLDHIEAFLRKLSDAETAIDGNIRISGTNDGIIQSLKNRFPSLAEKIVKQE